MRTPTQDKVERFHPRVAANLKVKVAVAGKLQSVRATNLSMAGLYLDGWAGLGSERVNLAVPLPNDREIFTSARVVRKDADGLALEFERLDWEDMFALARYLHPRLP